MSSDTQAAPPSGAFWTDVGRQTTPNADPTVERQVQNLDSLDEAVSSVLTRPREADVTEAQLGPGGGPTVRRMLVGSQLRRLRTEKGLSREQAGEAIRASEWKIHRLENGQVSFKERDIVDLLRLYGATDPDEVVAFLMLAREANAPGWWQQYGDLLPQWFRAYVDLESAATLIRTYEGQFIPGLLQTEDYMRAVIGGAHLDESPDEAERRVALRVARQALLTRVDAPRLWAVVDEAALRRPVGGPEVMRAQLERLIEATKLANVVLQILPFGAGAHPAMVGAFSILRFPDQELPDVVYVEHLTNALYLDRRDDVNQHLHVMDSISVRAAPPDKTVDILHKILTEL
jgi:transcriptional regulator with XRE-family HTH domain